MKILDALCSAMLPLLALAYAVYWVCVLLNKIGIV